MESLSERIKNIRKRIIEEVKERDDATEEISNTKEEIEDAMEYVLYLEESVKQSGINAHLLRKHLVNLEKQEEFIPQQQLD